MESPRSEAGFALIEVIVAAAVLAIVALAALSGIDGANRASAREKARAVAANLAEQDQERLRAMPVDVLRNPPQSGDITVDGVKYQVKSEARWITDEKSEKVCGARTDQVEYLHIVTTVSSAIVGRHIPPVTIDSLVAPTTQWAEDHGGLGLKITDRTATKGVAGITVSAVSSTGYAPPNATTDANGCADFGSVPVGSYKMTVDKAGYLDRNLNQKSTVNQTVVRKSIGFASLQYDKATQVQATIKTHIPGQAYSATTAKDSKAVKLSMTNGANVGMLRTVTPGSPAAQILASGLYPYAENQYTFFTGECRYASPDTYTANKSYFSQTNALAAVWADPTVTQPQQATILQPPLNARITRRSDASKSFNDSGDIQVYAKLYKPTNSTDSCDEDVYTLATMAWPASGWGSAPAKTNGNNNDHWLTQAGGTFDPGMPFGSYRFCVLDTVAKQVGISPAYDHTTPNGATASQDISIATWTPYSTTSPSASLCNWPTS